jgi:hypothetical protein
MSGSPVRAKPKGLRARADPGTSTWQLLGAFLAPTTAVTAILYYFGWVRASTMYNYFGVDVSRTLGLSATDYVRNSSTVVFTPVAALLITALAFALASRVADRFLTRPNNAPRLRQLGYALPIVSAVLLVAAAVLLMHPDLVRTTPLIKPTLLALGSLLALYGAHIRSLIGRRQWQRQSKPDLAVSLYRGIVWGMVVLALFWATSILARQQGLEAAHQLERDLDGATGVVVYAHDRQNISGAGINVVALGTSQSAFRYRYTGLRLLGRSADGGYVLLPRWWTHTDGSPAYVLPPSSGIRVDLLALPLD